MEEQVLSFLNELEGDRGFSNNTVSAYGNDLRQFVRFLSDELELQSWKELAASHLTSYRLFLGDRKYAKSTVARKVAAVKSFSHYLVAQGILRADPAENLAAPRVDKFTPRAISESEMERLLSEPCKYKTPEAIRDRAMLEMLYATGMRVSELTALDLSDVDLESSEVSCGKNPERSRGIDLSESACEALSEYLRVGRPLMVNAVETPAVFLNHRGSRLTRQGFWLILKSYADATGIGEITPHTLRHSFAVHQLKNGRDMREIQRIMGHMSLSTTQVYQQLLSRNGAKDEDPGQVYEAAGAGPARSAD